MINLRPVRVGADIHVIPKKDVIDHECDKTCVCGPEVEGFVPRGKKSIYWMYTHHYLTPQQNRE